MSDTEDGPDANISRSNVAFGAFIKHLRTDRGFTHVQLAELSGLVPDTIQRLERGAFSPSFDTIRKLAGGVDMRLSDLFEQFEARCDSSASSKPG